MSPKNVLLGGSLILAILLIGSLIVTATFMQYGSSADDSITELSTAPTIAEAQATSIASSAIKGDVEEIELEKENGRLLYSVEITNEKGEHDIKIDPYTGEIVEIKIEDDVGRRELSLIKTKITEEQAKTIALGNVKGTVKEVEVEKVNGRYLYEVEVYNDGRQFDVSIDLVTGEVVSVKEELEEKDDEEDEDSVELSKLNSFTFGSISEEEAIRIAEDRLGNSFDLEEVDAGSYRGVKVWELEFEGSSKEAEVIIDMQTGEILNIEYEEDDDDED